VLERIFSPEVGSASDLSGPLRSPGCCSESGDVEHETTHDGSASSLAPHCSQNDHQRESKIQSSRSQKHGLRVRPRSPSAHLLGIAMKEAIRRRSKPPINAHGLGFEEPQAEKKAAHSQIFACD
jgi:hypothetical protein